MKRIDLASIFLFEYDQYDQMIPSLNFFLLNSMENKAPLLDLSHKITYNLLTFKRAMIKKTA